MVRIDAAAMGALVPADAQLEVLHEVMHMNIYICLCLCVCVRVTNVCVVLDPIRALCMQWGDGNMAVRSIYPSKQPAGPPNWITYGG